MRGGAARIAMLVLGGWAAATGCTGAEPGASTVRARPEQSQPVRGPSLTPESFSGHVSGSSSSAAPATTADTTPGSEGPPSVIVVDQAGEVNGVDLRVGLAFESRVDDVSSAELRDVALGVLGDDRGWRSAGFEFFEQPTSSLRVILAEGAAVDQLCLPLQTRSRVSCQNGAIVALNADRWRSAVVHWDGSVELYRTYLVNHEIGHLIGMRHPVPRCPRVGAPAAVMEQQTSSLEGCLGNGWPRDWELEQARVRPAVIGPDPSWGPDPVPTNQEGN